MRATNLLRQIHFARFQHMQLRLIAIVCSLVIGAPVCADEGMPRYAITASKVANAIQAGAVADVTELLPELLDEERTALAAAAGCKAEMGDGTSSNFVRIVWICGNDADQLATTMRFTDKGEMFALELNPVFDREANADKKLKSADVRDTATIAKDFARAVVSGADPTLGGLVPVQEYQMAQLSASGATRWRLSSPRKPNMQFLLLHGGNLPPREHKQVTVHFELTGQPLGITISKAAVRQQTFIW